MLDRLSRRVVVSSYLISFPTHAYHILTHPFTTSPSLSPSLSHFVPTGATGPLGGRDSGEGGGRRHTGLHAGRVAFWRERVCVHHDRVCAFGQARYF